MLDRLEALALEATPGMPDEHWYVLDGTRVSAYNSNCVALTHGLNAENNAAYIAAANPADVLKIIAALKAAQRLIGYMKSAECGPLDAPADALRMALAELEDGK